MSYMGDAYLLSRDGDIIPVENHPTGSWEFDDVIYVLSTYGETEDKNIADMYEANPSPELKQIVLQRYNNQWCKIREWKNCTELTFRITSDDGFNWYSTIVSFLVEHPGYSAAKITVESDKTSNGTSQKHVYWQDITYEEAIDPALESILSSKLVHGSESNIIFL